MLFFPTIKPCLKLVQYDLNSFEYFFLLTFFNYNFYLEIISGLQKMAKIVWTTLIPSTQIHQFNISPYSAFVLSLIV